jgi:FtsP/CotA-like multicopper oxidase with cupredoxin domain
MRTFQRAGDTVICLARVENTFTAALATPATSMKITIYDPSGTAVVTAADMTNSDPVLTVDGIGYNYYYDYNPAVDAPLGEYKYHCLAVDGTRKTEFDGKFVLE